MGSEEVVPAGFGGLPLHVHPSFDEGFYVLECELTFRMEDELASGGAGDIRLRAPGAPLTPSPTAAGRERADQVYASPKCLAGTTRTKSEYYWIPVLVSV